MKKIVIAGTILADKIYEIDGYPKEGELVKINAVETAVGGCVPNVAADIKSISNNLSVSAVGRVGVDSDGEFILSKLKKCGVDTSGIIKDAEKATSFTAVMSVKGGQRTFFTHTGACGEFSFNDVFFNEKVNLNDADLLHLGYFLLLDKIDGGDGEIILKEAKKKGIKTSVDMVSEHSDRYKLVLPCLKYVDYLIINEVEAARLAGVKETNDLRFLAEKLFAFGVNEKVIIHCAKSAACLSKSGYTELGSYILPNGYIKGTTGAGDAFCAGVLVGIAKNYSDMEILSLGSKAAVASLGASDSISGVKDETKLDKICCELERRKICL